MGCSQAATGEKQRQKQLVEETHARIFFLDYAPVLITSALTGEKRGKVICINRTSQRARGSASAPGLNRLLRQAFEANPPPLVKGRRLKLFYAAQSRGKETA